MFEDLNPSEGREGDKPFLEQSMTNSMHIFPSGRNVLLNFTGEDRIMKMFQPKEHRTLTVSKKFPMTTRFSPLALRKPLTEKISLYQELGYKVNVSGYDYPDMSKRRGCLMYVSPASRQCFLAGMLTQSNRKNVLLSNKLTWIDLPAAKLSPNVWFLVRQHDDTYKGLIAIPEPASEVQTTVVEAHTEFSLWRSSRWYLQPRDLPLSIQEVLDYVGRKYQLRSEITVDCLGERVFDIHMYHCLDGLKFEPWSNDESILGQVLDVAAGCYFQSDPITVNSLEDWRPE